MTKQPIYFLHGAHNELRVRGYVVKRLNQHRMDVRAQAYVNEDGEDIGPAILDFTRSLSHNDVYARAGDVPAVEWKGNGE